MTNDDNAQAIFNRGMAAYEKNDLKQAKELFKAAADAGFSRAMFALGSIAEDIDDLAKAKRWYQLAADAGHSDAMVNLGVIAHQDNDLVEAKRWYQLAADTGHSDAMFNLGVIAEDTDDLSEAKRLWKLAADTGNSHAMFNLGRIAKTRVYILGDVNYEPEDTNGAIDWFTRAAKAGNAEAMLNLGEISKTNGNIEEEKYWYQLAADSGNTDAIEILESISISAKQYYAEVSDDLSAEILEILRERGYDHPKKLSQMELGDFAEVIDHIYGDEEYAEKLDGLMELFFACAARMKDPIQSLKLLQYSLVRYSRVLYDGWRDSGDLGSGVDLIWSVVFEASSLNKSEKTKMFKSIIDDEDSWDFPASALIMCLLWDLGPENMDYCILKYSNHRDSASAFDPWSLDSEDLHQWLYLLAVATLNSTASNEVMQVIDNTCSSSSVNAFWIIITELAEYGFDNNFLSDYTPGRFGLPGLSNWGDDWGSLLFHSHFRKIKADKKAVSALINLYKNNSKNWLWDFDSYAGGDQDHFDRFIDLWSSKLIYQ